MGELVERLERSRVELPQRRAELVELTLLGPDQVLMGSRGELDRIGECTVGFETSVVVSVESCDGCERSGVALI